MITRKKRLTAPVEPKVTGEVEARILALACSRPPEGHHRWNLRLADKLGREHGREGILLEVPLSRADLAGLARSTPESVSRVMSRWKREHLIDSGRCWVALQDRSRLQRIADEAED